MPNPQLVVIADDLTGALDAAAPFASAVNGVAVATRPDGLQGALATGADVVAVTTRSREVDAKVARGRVAAILATLPSGIRIVKKIDSRLKGNIAAELEPLADRPLVVLPAIPDFGRVVRGGSLEGFGVDTPLPVRDVLGRFAATAEVPDTVEQSEMVRQVVAAPPEAVLVGARGLAQALAEAMGLAAPPEPSSLPAPMCFAVGSTDPITLAQVAALRAARPDLAYILAASDTVLPPPGGEPHASVMLLQASPGTEGRPDHVAAEFARTAGPYLRAARSILLTGGATAEAAVDVLGIELLTVAGEALPGMPLCRMGAQFAVTKSGGFGPPDAFVRLARRPAKAEMDGVAVRGSNDAA